MSKTALTIFFMFDLQIPFHMFLKCHLIQKNLRKFKFDSHILAFGSMYLEKAAGTIFF